MTTRTRGAVLRELGHPLEIDHDVQIPALRRGQVLVKIAYSGVCHSQLMEVSGGRGEDRYLPHFLGHEGSGVVLAVGEAVTKVKVGDKVILGWIKGSGIEAGGTVYTSEKYGSINAGPVATFCETAIVSENRCSILPENLPLDIAVLFGCALLTGAGIITQTIRPAPRTSIGIFGLGGIGLSALVATHLFEDLEVFAFDVNDEKLDLAKKLGAKHVLNVRTRDSLEFIREKTNGVGLDYSVEASGQIKTIETAFAAVRKNGGLCVFASHPPAGQKMSLDPYDLICGKQIRGSWGGDAHPDRDIPALSQLYLEGKLPLELLISKDYCLENVNSALDDLQSHRVTRPVLTIDASLG